MKRNRALIEAIEAGDVKAVRRLLAAEKGLSSVAGPDGASPLFRAVSTSQRHPEIVGALLEAGAEARATDEDGANALHYSIGGNGRWSDLDTTLRVFRALVERGAALEVRQRYGWTPLMAAVMEGLPEDVAALLTLGAKPEVNFPDDALPGFARGLTLVAGAVAWPDKLGLLLGAGADPERRDRRALSPIEVARQVLAAAGTGTLSASFRKAVKGSIRLLDDAIRARAPRRPSAAGPRVRRKRKTRR